MSGKTLLKFGTVTLAVTMGFATLAPSYSVFASEKENTVNTTNNTNMVSFINDFNLDKNELYDLGVSDSEINALINTSSVSGITLKNGVAYDSNGNIILSKERGKLSWAVKAIRAVWDKIPTKVKVAIGGTAGFEKLLGYIDHFTGSVEDAVYNGLIYIGCSKTVAWWAMKIITALAF